jgi:hypothetical protein
MSGLPDPLSDPRSGGTAMTVSNELLGATALTVIGCLMAVHAHAETARPDPRKSENNTFVECTTLIDKCMPGTSSITKDIVCAAVEKHFKITKDGISCK